MAEPATTARPGATNSGKIVGFLCEWAASLDGLLAADGTLADNPDVKIIKVPCSGFVKPEWAELALKNGADGVFVVGCPMVDCHYREGNKFALGRFSGQRPPRLKTRGINPDRIALWWLSAEQGALLVHEIKQFQERVRAMPAEPAPAPAAPRPAPAPRD